MQLPVTLVVELPSPVLAMLDHLSQQNGDIIRRLAAIERAVTANTITDIITTEALMADFTALHDEVEANGDAVDSAVTLLNSLSAQLVDAADDPAEVQAIAAALAEQSDALAAAVTANTPAAPEPAPEV
jgi:peptidoglycan hydrolase CwlO-like protein